MVSSSEFHIQLVDLGLQGIAGLGSSVVTAKVRRGEAWRSKVLQCRTWRDIAGQAMAGHGRALAGPFWARGTTS